MTSCFNKFYEVVENKIGTVFERYGRFVSRHPWKIIILGVILNGLLGIGMLRLNVVNDVERVYTPIGSQASKDIDKIVELFPDKSGSNFFGYQMPNLGRFGEVIVIPKGGNILEGTFLVEVGVLYNFVLSINATDKSGNIVTLDDICARSFGNCSVDGDVFFDQQFINDVNSKTPLPFPYYIHKTRGPIYYEQLIGGAVVSSSNVLTSATMIILRVNLRTDSDYYTEMAKRWQDAFLKKIEGYSSNNFDIAYAHSDSMSEELNNNVSGDIAIFSGTFTIMITYACLATMTARCDVVGQRSNLGFAGVIAASLSVVSAFGICSASGVEFVSIVGVIPFLIIGIGVDDMFMLISGITNTNFDDDVETRIGETMRTSGVSITVTSLTDLLAFAAGASSIFLSVRNFCIYCGVTVIFCYINQATIFVASLAINEKRAAENRHFASCFKVKEPKDEEESGKSKCYMLCCTGRQPRDLSEAESFLDKVPRWLIPKLVLPIPGKIMILCLFVGYLGVSIWGVTRMEQGLVLKNLVAESSYYFTYREYLDNNFPSGTSVSLVFDEPLQYSDSSVQAHIEELLSTFKAEKTVQDHFEINWLTEYKKSANYKNSSEAGFIEGLQSFLSDIRNTRFQNDVITNRDNTRIKSSRNHLMSENIKDSQKQGQFMLRMRQLASDSSFSVIAFSPAFIYFEQYVAILPQTLQTLGIAVAMVFFVTCIFMPHPLLLVYITSAVALITVGIFGFFSFVDLTLSSITMIHVIMSIGFSVDFAAHICHGYMISTGTDRNDRTKNGIIRSGAPIFHGALSSILGVIMLAAAKSYIFFSFFKVMGLVVTFGILHALLLLPVVLSLIGPFPAIDSGVVNLEMSGMQNDNVKTGPDLPLLTPVAKGGDQHHSYMEEEQIILRDNQPIA